MSFKLKSFYNVDWTPIYRTLEEKGILGLANKGGTIRVHKDLIGEQLEETIKHEKVHIDDIKKGLLWYDDDYMYCRKNVNEKFKKIKRGHDIDGNSNLPHEKKANNK